MILNLGRVMKFLTLGNTFPQKIVAFVFLVTSLCGLAADSQIDERFASATCSAGKDFVLSCDYRYSAQLDVKEFQLEIDGKQVQIKPEEHRPFPATKEHSVSVLILADVSDPKRKNTVEVKYGKTIGEMLANLKPHQKVGLAEFDSDIRISAPIGSDAASLANASKSFKATGQATEFYKNILAGIEKILSRCPQLSFETQSSLNAILVWANSLRSEDLREFRPFWGRGQQHILFERTQT